MNEEKKYKIVNGTSYLENTPDKVIEWLETSRERKQRIRIFYGNPETGQDWLEEHDTIGYIGRSTGINKIPLLIKSNRSDGGSAILDNKIVKITTMGTDRKIHVVYQNENYCLSGLDFRIVELENAFYGYNFEVYYNNNIQTRFKTRIKAENYIKFLKGERNKI